MYRFSSNPQTQLWHWCLGHASNVRVVQASKLIDGINLGEVIGPDNETPSSYSELDNEDSDADVDNKPTTINEATENDLKCIKQLYKAYIKSKHIRIVKLKKMTLMIRKLQEVHIDL